MKKFLFIMVPVLAVVLTWILLPPQAPVGIGVIGVTNRLSAGLAVTVTVTNRTYRDLRFEAMILTLSNGVWATPHTDYWGFGRKGFVAVREHTTLLVQTHETPKVVRFRIQFWRDDRRRARWFETLWQRLSGRRRPPDWRGEIYISEPFHISPP